MSHESKANLHDEGTRTVSQLASRGQRGAAANAGWTLKTRGNQLSQRARALLQDEVKRDESRFCWLAPPRTDVAFHLVVDSDPIEGNLVTLGALICNANGVKQRHIRLIDAPEDELPALLSFLSFIAQHLVEIDRSNKADSTEQFAHFFVYEASEAKDLQDALKRHLKEPEIRTAFLDFVRLFPPEDVVPEPEYKGVHHLPACSLRSVIEQLYALPITVSYDLRSVSQALAKQLDEDYEPEPAFRRPFSARLSIDVARRWREGEETLEGAIRKDVSARLDTSRSLQRWLETQNAAAKVPFLRLNKEPFAFQETLNPLEATHLDLLMAQELLENRSGLLSRLVELARPADERRDRLRCYANLNLRKHWRRGVMPQLEMEFPKT